MVEVSLGSSLSLSWLLLFFRIDNIFGKGKGCIKVAIVFLYTDCVQPDLLTKKNCPQPNSPSRIPLGLETVNDWNKPKPCSYFAFNAHLIDGIVTPWSYNFNQIIHTFYYTLLITKRNIQATRKQIAFVQFYQSGILADSDGSCRLVRCVVSWFESLDPATLDEKVVDATSLININLN